jgi:hypothetical protein
MRGITNWRAALLLFAVIPAFAAGSIDATPGREVRASSSDTIIPQFVHGGGWSTTLTFVNTGDATVQFDVNFYKNDGSAWNVPIVGLTTPVGVKVTLPPKQTIDVQTRDGSVATEQGWAEVDYSIGAIGNVTGLGVFRQRVTGRPDFEAVVPLSYYLNSRAFLLFDETQGYSTGIAWVASRPYTSSTLTINIRDENGNRILLDQVTLKPLEKQVFSLGSRYPQTAGKRGSIEITCNPGYFSALGLRFNPSGAFTSIHTLDK